MEFRDAVFKGCTRPAMKFGVPLVPLIVVGGLIAITASATTLLLNLLIVPVVLVMAQVTRTDDQQWRLLWLKFYCRVVRYNSTARLWGASTYSPIKHRKR